jgi:beta-barrel assembly-enhancing protease
MFPGLWSKLSCEADAKSLTSESVCSPAPIKRARGGVVRAACWIGAFCLLLVPGSFAQRTQLKPPWNIYSPDTDIKEGQQFAHQAEKQLPLCNDPKVDAYLTQLGLKLAAKLPTGGVRYPFEFHCVNDKAINAFALPGGYVFINRGAIEAADNESQLAGVMAHELSHVALRHGTAQASKASLAQGAVSIFGGLFGGGSGGALLSQGAALGAGSLLLHYSRTAETQADVMGTQVLYDTGYDPRAMAQFFEKLEAESKGKNPPQFFSDHPNPENRLARVDEEVDKLGGVPPNAKRDSSEFEAIKREVLALPAAKPGSSSPGGVSAGGGPPAPPSANFATYQAKAYTMQYPDNWKKFADGNTDEATFSPDGGIVQGQGGQGGLAYGLIVGMAAGQGDSSDSNALENATRKLISSLQESNPNMNVTRQSAGVRLNGQPGLSTYLSNNSPASGQETDWLITVVRPEGLVYFICVAPENAYGNYDKTFDAILDSVRFNN